MPRLTSNSVRPATTGRPGFSQRILNAVRPSSVGPADPDAREEPLPPLPVRDDVAAIEPPSAALVHTEARPLPPSLTGENSPRRAILTSAPADIPAAMMCPVLPVVSSAPCFSGRQVTRAAVSSLGLDLSNRPGGLPFPTSHIYLSPEFRARLIAEINHTNFIFHHLFGMAYANSPQVPVEIGATTEGGDRLTRALQGFRDAEGSGGRANLPFLLMYCILQQEEPTIFDRYVRDQGLEQEWETLVTQWSGRVLPANGDLHPLLCGMMVVPIRRVGEHNYPRLGSIGMRPTCIVNSGWRSILGLTDASLGSLRDFFPTRYRGIYLDGESHESSANRVGYARYGNNLPHTSGFRLATPDMVEHFWTRFGTMFSFDTGGSCAPSMLSMFETLGLLDAYYTQSPLQVYNSGSLSWRQAWQTLGIPIPTLSNTPAPTPSS